MLSKVFEMTTFVNSFHKQVLGVNWIFLKPFLQTQTVFVNKARNNHFFKYLAKEKEHNEEYEYEVSRDAKEWQFVERLMPLETVPVPSEKACYPSGWRPSLDEALQHEYFIERSKNHMLPVYMDVYNRNGKITKIKNISGDIWKLHNELKEHIEEQRGRKISSFINEGSNTINFKGDYVYYCEQWLLNKGF